jgi:hypothetical protein
MQVPLSSNLGWRKRLVVDACGREFELALRWMRMVDVEEIERATMSMSMRFGRMRMWMFGTFVGRLNG